MADELQWNGQSPYGDIYQIQTPALDRLQQQLTANNLARQQYAQKEGQQLDGLLNKELAKVRSADMPSVIDAYNQYKSLKQRTLFDKKLLNDPKAWNAAQIEANSALGSLQTMINKSSQLNDFQKQLANERKTRFNLFSDDFGDKISAFNSTPMDQLANNSKYGDLTNPDNYRYKGSQTDFGKMELGAAGQPKPTFQVEEPFGNLQTKVTPYNFGNSPAQFFETIKGNLSQRIPFRDAAAAWESIPQAQKDEVDKQFAQISPEKWKQMTGSEKPQVIAPQDPNNPAENYAAYRAKIYAINAAPKQGTPIFRTNQEQKQKTLFNEKVALEAIRQNHRIDLKNLSHAFKQMDADEQGAKLDVLFKGLIDDAKNSGTYTYKSADGKVSKQYEIKASPFLKKSFTVPDENGHAMQPDAFRLSEDGKYVTPLFFQENQTGDRKAVDSKISKPMTAEEFKAILGKSLVGLKEANKASVGTEGDNSSPTSAPQIKKKIAGW